MTEKSAPQVEIQERGEVYFFYRPKVQKQEAHSADDVQRLYIILRPTAVEEKKHTQDDGKEGYPGENERQEPLFRLIVMGRKRLPEKKTRPYWGFVDLVTTSTDHVKSALKEKEYDTATRGHRHTTAVRPAGEGIYRIVKHVADSGGKKKTHTHFIYRLEFPTEEVGNEPQESLNIQREASFIIQIKNPEGDSAGIQNKRKAAYPARLQGKFGRVRYCAVDPPDFLNYEGCEFLLIGASDDIEEELGLDLMTDTYCSESDLVGTFGDQDMPTDPLLKGTWG